MIENWKDTAFGSDFGGDFLELVEKIADEEITLDLIYTHTDIKKYLENPQLLDARTDNNVYFTQSPFEQYIHFEDAIIGLSALIIENELHGKVDLTKAYGNKVLVFKPSENTLIPVFNALQHIYNYPEKYMLFEMCMGEERQAVLQDIQQMIIEFEKIVK